MLRPHYEAKAHCPAPSRQGGGQLRNPEGFTSVGGWGGPRLGAPSFGWCSDGDSNTGAEGVGAADFVRLVRW